MHARYHSPSLAEVRYAAALASAGHLTRLDCLVLEDISLGAVAAGDLASLCRCVRGVEARAADDPLVSQSVFTITEKAPTSAFCLLVESAYLVLSHLRQY